MAEIKEITAMCRAGNCDEAYLLASAEMNESADNPWTHRKMGWVLYYLIKEDAEKGDYIKLLNHIDELQSLNLLTADHDSMIFDNVQFKIAEFVKNHLSVADVNSLGKLSTLFDKLKNYNFHSSKGHSYLLQSFIKFDNWNEMADFFDWWNLDNLSNEDYQPYITPKGQKMITVAERAYIANAKALLKLTTIERIEQFLSKLEVLMNRHEEMIYPGYFYGKLLLKLGGEEEEALEVLLPFARKKSTEFWVWQLLSDVFIHDTDKQMACLLRAVHCKTQESFLGKVRIKLADLYIQRGELGKARHHIDAVTRCYVSQEWRLPKEIDQWTHESWLNATKPENGNEMDYKSITDNILCKDTAECLAVVSYIDTNSKRYSLIYGFKQKTSLKLPLKLAVGDAVKMHYIIDKEGHFKALSYEKATLQNNLNYVQLLNGVIEKQDNKEFAFLKSGATKCFIAPAIVQKYNLKNNATVVGWAVYDYNKKKESWNWCCVRIKK